MTLNIVYVVYPRSAHAHFNARTATWLNKKRIYNIVYMYDSKIAYMYIAYPGELRHISMPGLLLG